MDLRTRLTLLDIGSAYAVTDTAAEFLEANPNDSETWEAVRRLVSGECTEPQPLGGGAAPAYTLALAANGGAS